MLLLMAPNETELVYNVEAWSDLIKKQWNAIFTQDLVWLYRENLNS